MFTIPWVLKAVDNLNESTHFNVYEWAEQNILQKQTIIANVSLYNYTGFIVLACNI